MTRVFFVFCLAAGFAGCDEPANREEAAIAAVDFDGHECAVCGMIVREQPSPRGQVVHSDGTRAFLCAMSDLLIYLQAPSPHGATTGAFIDLNDAEASDPTAFDTATRPWIEASDATYVIDFERDHVMGRPALAYDSPDDAARVASAVGGKTTDWDGLQSVPPSAD